MAVWIREAGGWVLTDRKRAPKLTFSVDLPGGRDRLRQMVLHVSALNRRAKRFGRIKLNKILWKADFDSFAARQQPVTGREYQRLELGPAPKEMVVIRGDLLKVQAIREELIDFGDDIIEYRPVPLKRANLRLFTKEDLSFVDSSIRYYWEKTGIEASDDSHGVAWRVLQNGSLMAYELSLLSDRPSEKAQRSRLEHLIHERRWASE